MKNAHIHAHFHLQRRGFELSVDVDLAESGIVSIFGPSGSGKSTLLRCIAGLERAKSGEFSIDGQAWQTANHFLPPHQREVGFVFQHTNLFMHLNVKSNLEYGMKRIPKAQRVVSMDEAITLLGLEPLLNRTPQQLSGGQKQRVAIARALLTSPKLLLMDEPLASLDLDSKADILPYLERLHDELNTPMLYVTHAPEEVVRVADQLILMADGKVTASGAVNELMTRMDLPLAHFDEACAVMDGRVHSHDTTYHLTHVSIPGGKVAVSYRDLPIGHSVRVRILARDVSLALAPIDNSSITNIFPARVIAIQPMQDPAQVLIKLDMGGTPILSRVTKRSVHILGIESNQIIYAQVKSVALMR